MSRPPFRIECCLCGKSIPKTADVHALDAEWQRRFPEMIGVLACPKCALERHQWKCRDRTGTYVDGHVPSTHQPEGRDLDSWSHFDDVGTHVVMVCLYPESGVLQGAEDYLRAVVKRPGTNEEVANRLQAALDAVGTSSTQRREETVDCPGCSTEQQPTTPPIYQHVHWNPLPRRRRTDNQVVIHGYATGLWGDGVKMWYFFEYLEPALAFGRAGRMGSNVTGYGVHEAAVEVRLDTTEGREVRTLHLAGDNLDRTDDELDALRRWLDGVRVESSHYWPPDHK